MMDKGIYDRIIDRAKERNFNKNEGSVYFERHHIIPKCIGGSDNEENIANLTAEEHYLAHQLLVKIYPGNNKLIYALGVMCVSPKNNGKRLNNKEYSWIRKLRAEEIRKLHTGKVVSEETRKKMSDSKKITQLGSGNSFYGKTHSEDFNKLQAERMRIRFSKPIEIDGIRYPSITEASKMLGISIYRINKIAGRL